METLTALCLLNMFVHYKGNPEVLDIVSLQCVCFGLLLFLMNEECKKGASIGLVIL